MDLLDQHYRVDLEQLVVEEDILVVEEDVLPAVVVKMVQEAAEADIFILH